MPVQHTNLELGLMIVECAHELLQPYFGAKAAVREILKAKPKCRNPGQDVKDCFKANSKYARIRRVEKLMVRLFHNVVFIYGSKCQLPIVLGDQVKVFEVISWRL